MKPSVLPSHSVLNYRIMRMCTVGAIALSLVLGTVRPASAVHGPVLVAPLSFDVGSNPRAVAIGDLNGDGKLDLTVANSGSATVSVLLGRGDGNFGPKNDYGTGSNPHSVAIGDLNRDGKPDLAVATESSATLSILLGNGDGTFGSKSEYDGGGSISVAIGDLNGDGNPDLAACGGSDTVSVLLGNGDGAFGPKSSYGTGSNPQSIAIGDFNGDRKPDLAVADFGLYPLGGSVSVLLGNGDGTFGPRRDYATPDGSLSLAIGDVNGDGKTDLAVASLYPPTVSVLLGNGDGSFGPRTDYGTTRASLSVAIGDLNGDGRQDLAVAIVGFYRGQGNVALLLGNGDGTFGPENDYGTGEGPDFVAIGDLNGDGKQDLAVANSGSNSVWAMLGNGSGSFPPTSYGALVGPISVAIGDLNRDGNPDLAAVGTGSYPDEFDHVQVLLGSGDGSFFSISDYGEWIYPNSVAIGDLNRDGNLDLVVAASPVSVLLGNGDGTFGPMIDLGIGASFVAIGDLNGDGKSDLAVTGGFATASVLLGNGDGSFGPESEYGTSGGTFVAIGDLNGDGKMDLATANNRSSTVSVLLGNGDGTFSPNGDYGTGSLPRSVAIGDLNGDGKPDLATANNGSATISVLLGNGDGAFGPRTDYETGVYPSSVVLGDLNGDGEPDLATNAGSDTVSVLLASGDGTFGPKTDYGTGSGPSFVAIGDLNLDGKPDLAVANGFDDSVSVLLNTGVGPDIALVCSAASAVDSSLWPPNHQMAPVTIAGVADPDGDPVTITVTGVTQDEPVNSRGAGDTSPDARIVDGNAQVRAERSAQSHNGRVYRISFRAEDGRGGHCEGAVTVCVPHDQRKSQACVDDGQNYDSTGGGG